MTHDELGMIVVAVRREQDRQKVEIGGLKACIVQLQNCVFGELKLTPDVPSTTPTLRNLAADLARDVAPAPLQNSVKPAPFNHEESAEKQSGVGYSAAYSPEAVAKMQRQLEELEAEEIAASGMVNQWTLEERTIRKRLDEVRARLET